MFFLIHWNRAASSFQGLKIMSLQALPERIKGVGSAGKCCFAAVRDVVLVQAGASPERLPMKLAPTRQVAGGASTRPPRQHPCKASPLTLSHLPLTLTLTGCLQTAMLRCQPASRRKTWCRSTRHGLLSWRVGSAQLGGR